MSVLMAVSRTGAVVSGYTLRMGVWGRYVQKVLYPALEFFGLGEFHRRVLRKNQRSVIDGITSGDCPASSGRCHVTCNSCCKKIGMRF